MSLYDNKTNQMISNEWPVNQVTAYCCNDVIATENYWVKLVREIFEITKVIWNDDAVIVFWSDKTKTVVKRMEADEDDIYSAVAQALAKKIYGGTGAFHGAVDAVLQDKRCINNELVKIHMKRLNELFGLPTFW